MVITFKRKQGMTFEDFQAYRRDVHAPMLFEIPEAQLIRRFIVSYPIAAPGWAEPSYDALVEVWFDSAEECDTLFFSENFKNKVDPDHVNFIDLATIQRMISQEIVVVG